MSLENVKIKMKLVVKYNSLKYAEDTKSYKEYKIALNSNLNNSLTSCDHNFNILSPK